MKYSEFEREVEKLGFTHNRRREEIVVKVDGETVMGVSTSRKYIVDNEWEKYQELNETTQEKLFDLAYKLAKTPLAEREEEKKYNVILPNILRDRKPILLCKSFDDHESCGIDWSPKDWLDDNMDRHIFTEQEIKDIDERYLAFKVEVTE